MSPQKEEWHNAGNVKLLQRDPYFVDILKAERGAAQAALSSSDADVPRVSNVDREVTAGKAGERAHLLDFAVALSKDARSVLVEAVHGGGTISIRRDLSGGRRPFLRSATLASKLRKLVNSRGGQAMRDGSGQSTQDRAAASDIRNCAR